MPPTRQPPPEGVNPRECPQCHKELARPGDIPRHMRIHADPELKTALSYRCPWKDCKYENLQKSNVDTHLRTHTNNKAFFCPDAECDFATCDPASLTRHRKRHHQYVPKPRKKRARIPDKFPTAEEPSQPSSSASSDNGSVTPAGPPPTAILTVFTPPVVLPPAFDVSGMFTSSYTKKVESLDSPTEVKYYASFEQIISRPPVAKVLFPAYESVHALEAVDATADLMLPRSAMDLTLLVIATQGSAHRVDKIMAVLQRVVCHILSTVATLYTLVCATAAVDLWLLIKKHLLSDDKTGEDEPGAGM